MKKNMVKLFRLLSFVILLVIIFLIIFLIIFWNINRMKGNIVVTINGEEYLLESLECKYVGEGNDEKITYKKNTSGMTFKNRGLLHGMYEYSFLINNEEINIEPKIRVFKTNWWKIYDINIDINVYEDNKIWNADISIDIDNRHYKETFYDIENNVIEFRVE